MAWKNKRGMSAIKRETVTIDATDKVVGRLATHIAKILMGKDKPDYTPHIDSGVIVKVSNADKLVFTGKKLEQKVHFSTSNRPGGLKTTPVKTLRKDSCETIIKHAVIYMLPKNRTQSLRMKRLSFN